MQPARLQLIPSETNARTHSTEQVAEIARSINAFGFVMPVLIRADGTLIAGHGRRLAAMQLGLTEVPAIVADHLSEEESRAYNIADNRLAEKAGWDKELLAAELEWLDLQGLEMSLTGFNEDDLDAMLAAAEEGVEKAAKPTKADTPAKAAPAASENKPQPAASFNPETVSALDGRAFAGRVEFWRAKGVPDAFNAALAEIIYTWYAKEGAAVFDPFAADPVRGMVAAYLGLQYVALDARQDVIANARAVWERLGAEAKVIGTATTGQLDTGVPVFSPVWNEGDATRFAPAIACDFLFTQAPRWHPSNKDGAERDLTGFAWPAYAMGYGEALEKAVERLQDHRYAVVVVRPQRDVRGRLVDMVAETVQIMQGAGLTWHGQAMFSDPAEAERGSPNKLFKTHRRLTDGHAAVLIFLKGDEKQAIALLKSPKKAG